MKPLRKGWRRLLGSLKGNERALADELASHIEMQTEDNVLAGMPPAEARRAAVLKFGGVEGVKESYRDQRGLPWLDGAWADLRYAARTLRKSSSLTLVAVLTLAVAIGANTAIFSLLDQLLIHPPGIDDAERVLTVVTRYGKLGAGSQTSSAAVLKDMQTATDVFERVALADGNATGWNYSGGDNAERLYAPGVTAEWFDVFGAKPLLGRVFTAEEDQPGANRVVVLSHAAWTRLFGADPAVVGRTIELSGTPHQIIGVMQPDFRLPREVDLWRPAGLPPQMYANRFSESAFIVARARPGVSLEQARAWLGVLTDRVRSSDSADSATARAQGWSVSAIPFTDSTAGAGSNKTSMILLSGAVGLVLLIACANIAGLMVARTSARARELAVRSALGASRARLVRQAIAESSLLAVAGGLAGAALASWAVQILLLFSPVTGLSAELDSYVLTYCAAVTVAAGMLSGLAPAWQVLRSGPQGGLQAVGRSVTADVSKQRLRSALVIGETALALTLLVSAGLLIKSFVRLQDENPGFDPQGVMTAIVALPSSDYPAVLERVRAAPGVSVAGLVWPVPFSYNNQGGPFAIEGRTRDPNEPLPSADRRRITPGYMEALSIPLRRGRYFSESDRTNTGLVTIIDENLARRYWPGEDPLGQRIRLGPEGNPWFTIVGIVGHVAHPDIASDSGTGVYYVSLLQGERDGSVGIMAKTTGDPAALAGAIREAVRAVDPDEPVHTLNTMQEYVSDSLSTQRFGIRLLGFFAATALFLAALGLYGVISYSVTQRTRELGIRMALGAGRAAVLKLVVGQGLRLAGIGVAIGLCASLPAGRIIESELFGVSASDPAMIAAMASMLIAAALAASYLPARRAMRVDPVETLRHE